MSDAGRGDVGLERRRRRAAGPRLEKSASVVVAVDGADGQRGVGGAGRADRVLAAPSLPAAMTNSAPVSAVSPLTAWLSGSVPSVALAAEAHVDDLGALAGGPLHPGDDPGVVAEAVVVEHLADEQVRARRDTLACRSPAPVPATVERRACRARTGRPASGLSVKFCACRDLPGQVRVRRRRRRCRARRPSTPVPSYPASHAGGRADLGDAAVERPARPCRRARSARCRASGSDCQNSVARRLSARNALPCTLFSVTPTSAAAGVTEAGNRPGAGDDQRQRCRSASSA